MPKSIKLSDSAAIALENVLTKMLTNLEADRWNPELVFPNETFAFTTSREALLWEVVYACRKSDTNTNRRF